MNSCLYELAKSDTKQNPGKKPSKQKASSKSTVKAITELRSINSPSPIVSTPPVIQTSVESGLPTDTSTSTNTESQLVASLSSAKFSYLCSCSVMSECFITRKCICHFNIL